MRYIRGNRALRDHAKEGKRVFLFKQSAKGFVRFEGELMFLDCDFETIADRNGQLRRGIKFFFKRIGAVVSYDLSKLSINEPQGNYWRPSLTERSGLVLSRVGQGAYRKSIINRWENKCAVTSFNDGRVLIASHIHQWKDATDEERLDVDNGILLSPNFDALFDRHLITFEKTGKIVLSESIDHKEYQKLGVRGDEQIARFYESNHRYLVKHQLIFQNTTSSYK